jgi:Predicted permease.
LMVLLFLRDRKHELGIYLSFGERRSKIIGQIILELLLIGGVACLLSLVTGYFLGNILSDSLLQTDWMADTSEQMGVYYENWLATNVSYQEVQSAYEVSFSIGYVISYLLLGLGTIVLSALVPLLYILRLNPKKIMM